MNKRIEVLSRNIGPIKKPDGNVKTGKYKIGNLKIY